MAAARPWADIHGIGMVSAAGETFADVAAAYVDRRRFLIRDPSLIGSDGMPQRIARAWVDRPRDIVERLNRLIRAAQAQCLASFTASLSTAERRYPMLLALPGWLEHRPEARMLAERLADEPPVAVERTHLRFGGHADSLAALGSAAAAVIRQGLPGAFIVAADSQVLPDALDRLALAGALLTADNPYGLVPGEAGVAMFLGGMDAAPEPLGRIAALAQAQEEVRPYDSEGSVLGRGLARCWRSALAALPEGKAPDRLLADLNGQRHRAEEFGFALASVAPRLAALAGEPEVPSLCMGDLGSASGLALAALAFGPMPLPRRDASVAVETPCRIRRGFVSASSWDGARAAALLLAVRPSDDITA